MTNLHLRQKGERTKSPRTVIDGDLCAGKRIIDCVYENYCDFSLKNDSIVQMCGEAYHSKKGQLPIIYADYYFVEAARMLCGRNIINRA